MLGLALALTAKLKPMFSRRLTRQLTAWLAAMAVLLGSLLPVLSHAVVAHTAVGQGWVEVCTVSGMAWVRQQGDEPGRMAMYGVAPGASASSDAGDPGSPQVPSTSVTPSDCGWCATHAPALALPGLNAVAVLTTLGQADVPLAFLHAPRLLQVWATAQSRAPPLLA
jgi:hypothetical protein